MQLRSCSLEHPDSVAHIPFFAALVLDTWTLAPDECAALTELCSGNLFDACQHERVAPVSWTATGSSGAQLRGSADQMHVVLRGRNLLKGSKVAGLFQVEGELLRAEDVPPKVQAACGQCHAAAGADVWHQRLGHPASNMIQKICHHGAMKNLEVKGNMHGSGEKCVTCTEGK